MESLRYIEVLADVSTSIGSASDSWPHRMEGVPPIVAVSDEWTSSFSNVRKYRELLDGLNYNAMFAESTQPNAKAILEAWESSGTPVSMKWLACNYRVLYREMAKVLKHWMAMSLNCFRTGKWKKNEQDEFSAICMKIGTLWKRRINELLKCYGYSQAEFEDLPNVLKERNENILRMFADPMRYDEFFETKEKNISQWGKKAASFVKHRWLNLEFGDAKKLHDFLVSDFPEIKIKTSFVVFRKHLPKSR